MGAVGVPYMKVFFLGQGLPFPSKNQTQFHWYACLSNSNFQEDPQGSTFLMPISAFSFWFYQFFKFQGWSRWSSTDLFMNFPWIKWSLFAWNRRYSPGTRCQLCCYSVSILPKVLELGSRVSLLDLSSSCFPMLALSSCRNRWVLDHRSWGLSPSPRLKVHDRYFWFPTLCSKA